MKAAKYAAASTAGVLGLAYAGVAVSPHGIRSRPGYWRLADRVALPILRSLDPETAHWLSILALRARLGPVEPRKSDTGILNISLLGKDLDCPVMVAAGYDKQGRAYDSLFDMGFGGVEIGGVTPKPQSGNERPRMWRVEYARAVINRFGLNSDGAGVVSKRVDKHHIPKNKLLTVNLAKNSSSTTAEQIVQDYVSGVSAFQDKADALVLNVSCPNVDWKSSTTELRSILESVSEFKRFSTKILLKLSPDMSHEMKSEISKLCVDFDVAAIVVSNTTTSRQGVEEDENSSQKGGLSGAPLKQKSLQTVKDMHALLGDAIPIIGVGGIESGDDAYEFVRAGASCVQIYTGMVYGGVSMLPSLKQQLAARLEHDGFESVGDAVGK